IAPQKQFGDSVVASCLPSCLRTTKSVKLLANRTLQDGVAKTVGFGVEQLRGSYPADSSNTKTKLVEAKLEMVCAAGLFHCGTACRPLRSLTCRTSRQRDAIHGWIQGCATPGAARRRRNRRARVTYKRCISHVAAHQRQRHSSCRQAGAPPQKVAGTRPK